MNKKTSFMGLALVALLASCSNGNVSIRLRECSAEGAVMAARSIFESRQSKFNMLSPDKIALTRPFYSVFPTDVKQFSGECYINIKNEFSYSGIGQSTNTEIKKTYNFDIEKCCYNCKISKTVTTNGLKATYPEVNYYMFFIENENQPEPDPEAFPTDLNNWGSCYILMDTENIKISSSPTDYVQKYNAFNEIGHEVFYTENIDSLNPFSEDFNASSPNLMNALFFSASLNEHDEEQTEVYDKVLSSDPLTTSNFLENFGGLTEYYSMLAMEMKEEEKDDIYAKVRYGSNDGSSLSLDTDINYWEEMEEEEDVPMIIKHSYNEKTSFIIQNLFMTESHATSTISTEARYAEENERAYNIGNLTTTVQIDQTFNYGKASCTIPSNIEEYRPIK